MKPSELLAPRGAWIQGSHSQNKLGLNVGPTDTTASRFCIVGAFDRCFKGTRAHQKAVKTLFDSLDIEISCAWGDRTLAQKRETALEQWNDRARTKKAMVIEELKKAGL